MFTRRTLPLVPLVICLLGGIVVAQEVREWTDLKGQKMSAKFHMLTPDQKLVLESEGKTYFIPLDRFSQEDQDYVKSLQDKPKQESDPSPAEPANSKPSPKKENLSENRQWTDFQGRQVKAKFLRMHEGRVILMQASTPRPVSFYTLSQEDQNWLRERLKERGEEDQILTREEVEMFHPTIHDAMDAALALRPPTESSSGTQGGADPAPARPPAYMPPDAEPYTPSANSGSPQGQSPADPASPSPRRPLFLPPEQDQPSTGPSTGPATGTAPGTAPGPNEFGGTAPTATESPASTESPGSDQVAVNTPSGSSMQPTPTDGSSGFRSRFDQRTSGLPPGHCPNCRKELPQGIGPGDHCPRCRFYLDESVSPGTGPPVAPWYERYNLVMIGGLAVVVIGALTLLSKKFQG